MHIPVLLNETISSLLGDPHGVYVDCTLGGGGHLKHLLEHLESDARVIAIDKDGGVLQATKQKIESANVSFVHGEFKNLKKILLQEKIDKVDGIMIDLGVSSFQLDNAERGFSFHENARLDMRMNPEQELTAWDIVNKYSEKEIAQILFEYGEERYGLRIARAVVRFREDQDIDTTLQLVDIIKSAVPGAYRREKHPGRKTFQALRIAVNGELESLEQVLPQALELLKSGGRLCIITFHSLEDRMVKKFMQDKAKGCICPPGLPVCICGHKPELTLMTRKPVAASENEAEENPRARSAKLRVAIKI